MKKIISILSLILPLCANAQSAKIEHEVLHGGINIIHQLKGTGKSPSSFSTVVVNYRGTFNDGSEFDNSFKRSQPEELPLNGVIRCWMNGIQKMKVGGRAILICPPSTAYGQVGVPDIIPPNSTLTFEIELLDVK